MPGATVGQAAEPELKPGIEPVPLRGRLLGLLLIVPIKVYQWTLSPLLGPCCRFYPSCSQYFILAVRKYGPLVGSMKGIGRICRCHPWHPGGYDPP